MTESMRVADVGIDYEGRIHDAMPLVDHVVRQVLSRIPRHVSRDDLTAAGLTAPAEAARGYDEGRGASFQTYATLRIRGAVLDELRSTDWASRSVRRRFRLVNDTVERLTGALERTPTDAELAEATGLSLVELAAHRADVCRSSIISLQAVTEHRGEDVLPSNTLTPEAILEHRELLAYLHDAGAALPQRLRMVIEEYTSSASAACSTSARIWG